VKILSPGPITRLAEGTADRRSLTSGAS